MNLSFYLTPPQVVTKFGGNRQQIQSYLKLHVLPQVENALQRINIELSRLEERGDLAELTKPKHVTLHHRMVLDLYEQCELLDLSVQRVESTYVPVSRQDLEYFRRLSFRVCSNFERAFVCREVAEERYQEILRQRDGRGILIFYENCTCNFNILRKWERYFNILTNLNCTCNWAISGLVCFCCVLR